MKGEKLLVKTGLFFSMHVSPYKESQKHIRLPSFLAPFGVMFKLPKMGHTISSPVKTCQKKKRMLQKSGGKTHQLVFLVPKTPAICRVPYTSQVVIPGSQVVFSTGFPESLPTYGLTMVTARTASKIYPKETYRNPATKHTIG